MSLRARLMIAFGYLLLLAVVSLSAPLAANVATRARTDFAVALTNRADEVARAAPGALDAGEAPLARAVGDDPAGRVVVTDAQGRLLLDSEGGRPVGFDYRFRREIAAALRGETTRLVRTHERGDPHYVVAVPLISHKRVVGAVRVDRSVAAVEAGVRRRLLSMLGVAAAVLAVGLAVAVAMARSIASPLRRLAAAAGRIGDGDLRPHVVEMNRPEVAEVTRALNSMAARIGETLRTQSDFLANASHQLRTPLTGLRLRLESLLDGESRAAAEAAISETDRLNLLVEDLLALVRAGTTPLRSASVQLTEAMEGAFDRWSISAAEHDHLLHIAAPSTAAEIAADPADVAIILDNLLENAITYTPVGTSIRLEAQVRPDEATLVVTDDGPGIPDADRPRIFDRFYRGSTGREHAGTGLGLAIVSEVAARGGGHVMLERGPGGRGARFSVTLPLAMANAQRVRSVTAPALP